MNPRLFGALLVLAFGLDVPPLSAQSPEAVSAEPPEAGHEPADESARADAPAAVAGDVARELTSEDLEVWLDGFMTYAQRRGNIAGSVAVVVKDGAILFQKGYGHADVDGQVPVDPERTLFRPGSVSKLFTWTAVMQLVEQGLLDLDTDIDTWLDFRIPARSDGPITLRHLMTHTAGFEESIRALIVTEPDELQSFEDALKVSIPARVYPAGTVPAYSNYGTALAGYIVERVSGLPFDDYVEERIFAPLEMRQSTFRQPLPAHLAADMSKAYTLATAAEKPFELLGLAPAGSLSTSGSDIARFMIAHLQQGEFGNARILGERTARLMHDTERVNIAPLNPMLLGFFDTSLNGRRVIGHGGNTFWFHSYLRLFIDDGVGLFVSFNTSGDQGSYAAIHTALFEQFSDRYLPGPNPDGEVEADVAEAQAQAIAGLYLSSRRSRTNLLAVGNLLNQTRVFANGDGGITLPGIRGVNRAATTWRPIGPWLWRDTASRNLLAAQVEEGRVVAFAINSSAPIMRFEPVPWWQSAAWLLPAAKASLAIVALTLLAWPTLAILRRRHRSQTPAVARRDTRVRVWMWLLSLSVLGLALAFQHTMTMIGHNLQWAVPSKDGLIIALRALSLVLLPVAVIASALHVWSVLRSGRGWPAAVWAVLLWLSFAVLLWIAAVFRVVGFSASY